MARLGRHLWRTDFLPLALWFTLEPSQSWPGIRILRSSLSSQPVAHAQHIIQFWDIRDSRYHYYYYYFFYYYCWLRILEKDPQGQAWGHWGPYAGDWPLFYIYTKTELLTASCWNRGKMTLKGALNQALLLKMCWPRILLLALNLEFIKMFPLAPK